MSGLAHYPAMSLRARVRFVLVMTCLLPAGAALAQGGEDLAKSWCTSCHQFPDPGLLDKKTWVTSVLPNMGARLGIRSFEGLEYHREDTAPPGSYPDAPLMEMGDWAKIVSYFRRNAPQAVAQPKWQKRTALDLFDIDVPAKPADDFPTDTAISIDEAGHRVLVGDGYGMDVEIHDADLKLETTVPVGGAMSRISMLDAGRYLGLVIGDGIRPTEEHDGRLVAFGGTGVETLADRLHRPVDFDHGDFNGDGATDYVTAGFGAHTGAVKLFLSQPDGSLKDEVLISDAGATSVAVDGRDLYVLMAQGNERIVRISGFASDADRHETAVLRFPPPQGSTHMQVLDFDGDGISDILYTAGDNADLSPILKPYHGVYLYLGQTDGSFRRSLFFPLDGAYSAVARDFDGDGDRDIAAVSYFPNLDHDLDEASFVYLENTGEGFTPEYVKGIGELGRFVAMSAGDVDGDGDIDIALANLAFGPSEPTPVPGHLQQKWIKAPHFVLLRNRLNRPDSK